MRLHRLLTALSCAIWMAAAAERSLLREAAAALERGDYPEAERALRQQLRTTPADPTALGLLGAILDHQEKYDEAGACYQRALALMPGSVSLLNNYGNHLLATKQVAAARATFLKVVALNPTHPNANAQLARMALDDKQAADALGYLDRLPPDAQRAQNVLLLHMRAFYLLGLNSEAESILATLSAAPGDSHVNFSIGLALAAAGQYSKAEMFLSQALEEAPADFDVLYNLGLAASHAGHQDRAYNVLQAALQLKQDDVDVLYNLGAIDFSRNRSEEALGWLARAGKLAPERSDIQYLLAQSAASLGYYPDSALAWDRYAKLVPKDEAARRERGFTAMLAGRHEEGLADLRWYVARHPQDAMAHYEMAVAETSFDREAALQHLNRAITLQPEFTAAHYARGVILYGQNQLEAALADFKVAASREPDNAAVLDQVGRTYLALDRSAEAVSVLRKAAQLSPKEPKVLMHLGRALSEIGETEEVRQVMARFRALKQDSPRGMPAAGYVELLALPPEEQYARYRARVEKAVRTDPNDVAAKLRYLNLLLADKTWPQAEAVAHEIAGLRPDPALVADTGRALLNAGRYTAAKEILSECRQAPGAPLDLAIAVFRGDSATAGLEAMDSITPEQRNGDYYLALAQMLDSAGRFEDAAAAVNQALGAAPTRADLYYQAALFLIKNERLPAALQLLEQVTKSFPNNPSLLLTKAIALEVALKVSQAEALLHEMERRWPEWAGLQLVYGIILQKHRNTGEAVRKLRAAIALGAREPAAYYYLAEATLQAHPDETDAALKAVREALALDPGDPWAHALAGRISFERDEYENALRELREAVRLQPRMVQAHYNLARVYQELGRREEARREVEEVRMLRERFPNAPDDPDLLHSNLFAVELPGR